MNVRSAGVEDAAAIAGVHVRTWQTAYEHVFGAERLAGLDLEARTANWERWLREPDAGVRQLVAEDESGRVVGFATCGPERDLPIRRSPPGAEPDGGGQAP